MVEGPLDKIKKVSQAFLAYYQGAGGLARTRFQSLPIIERSLEGLERQRHHCQPSCHLVYLGEPVAPRPETDRLILRFVVHAVHYHASTRLRR